MAGAVLDSFHLGAGPIIGKRVAVKEAVFPFARFPGVDTLLGPEMRSTGEVMGIDTNFGRAFYKAETASGTTLPDAGTVFLSLNDADKPAGLVVAKRFKELGLRIAATYGTAEYLSRFGVTVDQQVAKNSFESIVPDLAESWKWSDDGKQLSFRLRRGVKWHDGKPFTSADVVCTFDLLLGGESESKLDRKSVV